MNSKRLSGLPEWLNRSILIFIVSIILHTPAFLHVADVKAAIDEAMPDLIAPEIIDDWKDQDGTSYNNSIEKIKASLPAEFADKITGTDEAGYLSACHWRRVFRMKPYTAELENILFMKHHDFGGFEIGYHDNSDAGNTDQNWEAKSAMCLLSMKTYYTPFKEILTKSNAVVRDPCVSFDGKKVLFAMSGEAKGSGYKIYEMEIGNSETIKPLTFQPDGLPNVADFEPCYLPLGDIMFTSTRNFGINTNAFNPTTNMFLMDGKGNFIRQVGFDQAHTFYPVIMDDGTVLYTRWEFNDRVTTSCMGLFSMRPDGTHQTEFFGNQTSWPMTLIHARPIPGSKKVIAVAGGHHGPYSGELVIIDNRLNTNGTDAVSLIAPKRAPAPPAKKSDLAMGGVNFIFQNPCPLDEEYFLVSWRKDESIKRYSLYFMDLDGKRELIAWSDQSVSQPVLVKPRITPPDVARQANYRDSMGTYTMQDVYYGEGMKGIAKGTATSLRVVKLHYRVAGGTTGSAMGSGPEGVFTPAVICPISAFGASWDAKEVLGEAKIYEDGSASFKVPARTPVYFQVIDTNGFCIATMRSWSTLMPGETFSCVGCHEGKTTAPPSGNLPLAKTPQKLDVPLGIENAPFDYGKMVQPIFDKHCIRCHISGHESGLDLTGALVVNSSAKKAFTTSYNSLTKNISKTGSTKAINICTIFSPPEQQPPYSFGSSKSGIMLTGGLSGTHHDVEVTQTERSIVACWIDLCAPHAGKYNSYMTAADSSVYEKKIENRLKWAAIEAKNISGMVPPAILPEGKNIRSASITSKASSGMRYVPSRQAVVLKTAYQGTFALFDLQGCIITQAKLSHVNLDDPVTIPLPALLRTGVYVARFEGLHGSLQTTFSVTRH